MGANNESVSMAKEDKRMSNLIVALKGTAYELVAVQLLYRRDPDGVIATLK